MARAIAGCSQGFTPEPAPNPASLPLRPLAGFLRTPQAARGDLGRLGSDAEVIQLGPADVFTGLGGSGGGAGFPSSLPSPPF